MHIHILGSGAGGGFPQWNCNCRNCAGVRAGTLNALARTQSSITVSGDGQHWLLLNASPDIRAQLAAFAPLQPGRALRDTGIGAVLLIDSQIDHSTGLLFLREGQPLKLYCTEPVYQDLTTGLPLLRVLEHYCGVQWRALSLDGQAFSIPEVPGLSLRVVPLSSKAPPYSPHRHAAHPGDNIGVIIDNAAGRRLFYAPGLGELEPHLWPWLESADVLLVDGTFWSEDEMLTTGIAPKYARELGHLPQSGPDGMLAQLQALRGRKILIHINNTNPILDHDSPQHAAVRAAGFELAYDGLDIVL